MKKIVILLIALLFVGCSVPGKVTFRMVNGKWEPFEIEIASEYLPGDIEDIQEILNDE